MRLSGGSLDDRSASRRDVRTAILSNGTAEWLYSAVRCNGLDGMFDAVLSADAVQVYKPHPAVYGLAERALRVSARQISFQSSNGWDAWSASAYGMRAVWCNRSGQAPEFLPEAPEHTIFALGEILQLPPFLSDG
ncbi:haloacid dehalogenase, type II [Burkholderiales bacterium GJ-E10]|nr:haloacid dehalogenase, type II [Burkholderiales bacterium GJ-E10]